MADGTFWQYFPLLVGLPTWLLALTFLTRTVRDWPGVMQRWNEGKAQIRQDRQQVVEAQWARLQSEIDRLEKRNAERDKRIAALEAEEERCRRDLSGALNRIAELEGYMMGRGKADQEAARIIAAERADPDKAPTSREKFEGSGGK